MGAKGQLWCSPRTCPALEEGLSCCADSVLCCAVLCCAVLTVCSLGCTHWAVLAVLYSLCCAAVLCSLGAALLCEHGAVL